MVDINKLSAVDTLAAGDQLPVWDTSNGDTRRASLTTLTEYIQANITAVDSFITQYSAPSATGFSVQVNDDNDSVWLVLTPVAGYAAGTLVLPAVAKCVLGQEVLVNCTQAVTTLTIDGNGATVTGEPSALSANDFFRLRFDDVTDTWYRVG